MSNSAQMLSSSTGVGDNDGESDVEVQDLVQLLVLLLDDKNVRIYEARTIVYGVLQGRRAREEHRLLMISRMKDDELESAIAHRDAMRRCSKEANEINALREFVQTYRQIRYVPSVRPLTFVAVCARRVLKWIAKNGGFLSVCKSTTLLEGLLDVLNETSNWIEQGCAKSACTLHEVLLLACLTDVCRATMQLSTTLLVVAAAAPSAGHRSDVVALPSSSERIVSSNASILRHNNDGIRHLNLLFDLLHIARHIAHHRVAEDVKVHVSFLIAELMSVVDRLLPSSMSILPVERRVPLQESCVLSGVRVGESSRGKVEGSSTGNERVVNGKVWEYLSRIVPPEMLKAAAATLNLSPS